MKLLYPIKTNIKDHIRHTVKQSRNMSFGIGSWNAKRNISIYPVKRNGSINSNISIGINEIAVPIKTILIVEMIGVTLFWENDENIKHKDETVSITNVENIKLKPNLQIISSSPNSSIPLWKTINSPEARINNDTNRL